MLTSETLAQVAHQNVAASMATVGEIVAAACRPKRQRTRSQFPAGSGCHLIMFNEVPAGLLWDRE